MSHKPVILPIAVLLSVVLTGYLFSGQTTERTALANPSGTTFVTDADAYVLDTDPDTNYGTGNVLRAREQSLQSYLRFDVQGLGGVVKSATLRLYAKTDSATGVQVRRAESSAWNETGITYNTAPPYGEVIASSGAFGAGTWVSVNVTPAVQGDGAVTLVLTTPSGKTAFDSREMGGTAPQLVVQVNPPTPVPTNTPAPPSGAPTPVPGQPCPDWLHDAAHWHPPVDLSYGCYFQHEHGDAPPDWALNSQWMPMFDHPGNTPNENILKHRFFKAYSGRIKGVDIYAIFHQDFNPVGHPSRFHSYQIWARDKSGNVSHWDGWLDFGQDNNTGPNLRRNDACGNDGVRPIMMLNYEKCKTVAYESWYSRSTGSGPWGWDVGMNICPTYYAGKALGAEYDPNAPDTWKLVPRPCLGKDRRIEIAWYAKRSKVRGAFWATQWGQIVSGPGDPICGTEKSFGAKTYITLCIEQYIAPTMKTVAYPNNSMRKIYDVTGVEAPN